MKHTKLSRYFILFVTLFHATLTLAQTDKSIEAVRIENPPKIDGVLDDTVWESLPAYGNFNMYEPGNEGTIDPALQTEVKMAYDDKAVYVAAYLYYPNPDEIPSQFSQRDDVFVQADNFYVALNTYNDGLNETRFFVTSAGTIGDSRVTQNNQDFGYDVVFECRISKDNKGWYAEYRIPYNALRFPEVEVQNWSVNFYRRLVNENETHTWNFIKNDVGRATQYNGKVTGVRNIDPPTRLTFFPFAQGLFTNFDGESETNFSAGMDIKYGLSDSFTLDATLIPDFGQTSFDEVRLNLGPFEQTFGENRQFFTEGIDLFRKGGIFFSRRVGSRPTGNVGELNDSEVVDEFPEKVNLLNALKISGRTKEGLGIGFFNAVTEKTIAIVRDTLSGNAREVVVEPLANYNIIVLDQQFNENSSISLINTNVTRDGSFRDGNTSAFVFDVADKENRFGVSGRAIVSNVNDVDGTSTGFLSELDIARIKGNFRYRIGHDFANTTYDINDLGISFRNNFNNFVAGISYEIFEPTSIYNRYRISLTARHNRLYKPDVQTSNNFNLNSFFFTINRLAYGLNLGYNTDSDDYFEPRVPGRFVTFNRNFGGNVFVSTDFRKKFAFDAGFGYRTFLEDPQRNYFIDFSPRYRFSDKFLVILSSDFSINNKAFGYIDNTDTEIFFGQRDITNIENSITANYNFDPYKALNLRFRNFWSTADYSDNIFFTLNEDGTRTVTTYDVSENDPNRNFNIWNLDLSFRWRFAPGSEATLLYRNQIFNQDNLATLGYSESLDNLFAQPQQNSVSLRITYFLDYNNIKYLFNKES
ncbi:MAG: carbohydrate binding family 9 domain-containing protein [Flavobacteriales bacterium]|nr:carbohydrate binding family 9 domain-containing protein [Flavobacteriales bacterium]